MDAAPCSETPLLYYGPQSEPRARAAATSYGKLLPVETGVHIRKGDARALVEVFHRTVFRGRESVVVGPLDEISPEVGDVFLKTLEERSAHTPQPFLWAWDLGGVSPTLRSRCRAYWCPGVDPRWESYEATCGELLRSWRRRDWVEVVDQLKEARADLDPLLRATVELLVADVMSVDEDTRERALQLWSHLRPLMAGTPLTPARVTVAFLAAAEGCP